MASVQTLIDLARVKCGTDAELARRVGVPRSHVAMWKSGVRPVSPETVATICDVLQLSGEECREWVAVAMVENPKNAKVADRLRRALFASLAVGVGLSAIGPNDAQASTVATTSAKLAPPSTATPRPSSTDAINIAGRIRSVYYVYF